MRAKLVVLMWVCGCSGAVSSLDAGTEDAGASIDAGSPRVDAGTTVEQDAGTFGVDAGLPTGSRCADHTWKLCEDFESATTSTPPAGWSVLPGWGQGTVEVTSESVHGGFKALKSVSGNAGQPRIQKSLASLGATAGKHWGRVFYRVALPAPNAMNAGAYFHITFVGLRATDESRVVDTVQSPSGTIQYLYNLPDDSCCHGSSYDWRYDGQWHCAEWFVDDGADAYRFFLDGTELTSLAFTGKANARLASFTNVVLGSIYYVPSNGSLNAFIDDLAIDDARIGCQ